MTRWQIFEPRQLPHHGQRQCRLKAPADQPRWCEWADEHEVRRSFTKNNGQSLGSPWDRESKAGAALLEPATTEDGKLLAMHIEGSILLHDQHAARASV